MGMNCQHDLKDEHGAVLVCSQLATKVQSIVHRYKGRPDETWFYYWCDKHAPVHGDLLQMRTVEEVAGA